MRRKYKVFYTLNSYPLWYSENSKSWELNPKTPFSNTKHFSGFNAIKRLRADVNNIAKKYPEAEITYTRWFFKNGERYCIDFEYNNK